MNEEKIMDRIQKLLDKAMSTEFPAEQTALLQKADALMMQYSIDQIELQQRAKTDPTIKGQTIVNHEVMVFQRNADGDVDWEVDSALNSMFRSVATHYHTKINWRATPSERGKVTLLGYPSDIEFVEMLFTQLKMHMVTNLAPSLNREASWVENMANFKNMGLKWQDVHYKLQGHPEYPFDGLPWERRFGVKFTSTYKKFCDQLGEERVITSSPSTWRSDFIAGYVTKISSRLREIRSQTVDEGASNLPALLRNKDEEVMEMWYQLYPEDRPHDPDCQCTKCVERRKPVKMTGPGSRGGRGAFRYRNAGAMNAGARIAKTADLSTGASRVAKGTKGAIR